MRSKSITILAVLLSLAGQEWICLTHDHCFRHDCQLPNSRHTHKAHHHCPCHKHAQHSQPISQRSVGEPSDGQLPGNSHRCCAQSSPVISESAPFQIGVFHSILWKRQPQRELNERFDPLRLSSRLPSGSRQHIALCVLLC